MNINNVNQEEINIENNELDIQGKQIADLLDAHASRLSMRTLKQLENGRARVSVNHDGTLSNISAWADHHRIVSTGLVLGAVIAGFVVMQTLNQKESSDAFLLGADLPPEAFVDRGFEPSLNDAQAKL
jgi:hypothetical protein